MKNNNADSDLPVPADNLMYLYCITAGAPLPESYKDVYKIKVIEVNGLYVIYKEVGADEYSTDNIQLKIKDAVWLDFNVRDHLSILTSLMNVTTVIPFNFGTVYRTKERMLQFIADHEGDIRHNLLFFEGKEEWSVKLYFERKTIVDNINDISDAIRKLDDQIKISFPGKAYMLKKKKEEIIQNEIYDFYIKCSARISDILCFSCIDTKLLTIQQDERADNTEDMILNGSYLLLKENIAEFHASVDKILDDYQSTGVTVAVTGPWPPYSFIKMRSTNE